MRFIKALENLEEDNPSQDPTKAEVDEMVNKAIDDMKEPSPIIPDPIVLMLTTSKGIKSVKACRGVLGNYMVFRKYADPALGFTPSYVTWNHWTSVRSSLMSEKYQKEGITFGVHRGMRVLILPPSAKLPNLAVSESECYRIMC